MNGNRTGKRGGRIARRLLFIGVLVGGAAFLILWFRAASSSTSPTVSEPVNRLVVTNLAVGKADAAVLRCGRSTGIIDVGTEDAFLAIDSFLRAQGVSAIDFLILTHYDQDHIGSAVALLNTYPVGCVYLPDYVSDKRYYPGLMERVVGREDVTFVGESVTIPLDGLEITILPAADPASLLADENNRDNNMSLVCMATFGERKFLFTGDIEKDRIEQLINDDVSLEADWIKLPHHGAYEKKEREFLAEVAPQYAVISTSVERPPDEKLLKLLAETNISCYDTMRGDVTTVCDGRAITVEAAAFSVTQ